MVLLPKYPQEEALRGVLLCIKTIRTHLTLAPQSNFLSPARYSSDWKCSTFLAKKFKRWSARNSMQAHTQLAGTPQAFQAGYISFGCRLVHLLKRRNSFWSGEGATAVNKRVYDAHIHWKRNYRVRSMPFAAKENELVIGGKRHGVNTPNVKRNAPQFTITH